MRLTLAERHAPRTKKGGKVVCAKCKKVNPDLQQPCSKIGVPKDEKPAGARGEG